MINQYQLTILHMNEWLIFFSIVDRKKAAQYQFSFNDANNIRNPSKSVYNYMNMTITNNNKLKKNFSTL
ncbi:hypothetical protein DERF_010141 [Dermatophagoides farinae]|uniref:Uncharacterized protein n=1 Tax=Dermatophagoides farinae TaxID=6954 RepID=A0A922L290_DERFA|nr:hypothetical protein DERF_010141 [Dermatophagoides farinae]